MLCTKCKEYRIILMFEQYIITKKNCDSEKFNEIYENNLELSVDDCICDRCNHEIKKGISYIIDIEDFLDDVYEYFAKEIMNDIHCCQECGEGQDIQNIYPGLKSCYYDEEDDPEQMFAEMDTASTIEEIINDFFNDFDSFIESHYEEIVRHMQCPKCNNGSGTDMVEKMDFGEFDLSSEVYTENDIKQFNHNFYGDEIQSIDIELSEIAKNLNTKIYFCDTNSPWQRGLNENTNGLLRFFFKKGLDFTKISNDELQKVVMLINNRPRKTLDFLSPLEFILK